MRTPVSGSESRYVIPSSSSKSCEAALDLHRVERVHGHVTAGYRAQNGVVRSEARRERGRDRADPQLPGEAPSHHPELLVEAADVGENPARPLEHALALRRQPLEALRAAHDREADLASRRLIPDESVGWETWQARAARPKWRSRARAVR